MRDWKCLDLCLCIGGGRGLHWRRVCQPAVIHRNEVHMLNTQSHAHAHLSCWQTVDDQMHAQSHTPTNMHTYSRILVIMGLFRTIYCRVLVSPSSRLFCVFSRSKLPKTGRLGRVRKRLRSFGRKFFSCFGRYAAGSLSFYL